MLAAGIACAAGALAACDSGERPQAAGRSTAVPDGSVGGGSGGAGPARSAMPSPEPPPVIPPGDERFGINEGFAAAAFAHQLGARWTRWIVDWSEVYRNGPENFSDFYVDGNVLRREIRYGYKMMAVLRGTPEWARANPEHGLRSVPKGLDLPIDDPDNVWAGFVRNMVRYYAGRIDTWAIWNEVEIPSTGPNARYNTWAGTIEQYYRLLKVAWQVAHATNPRSRIILAPYSYHRDKEWLTRLLEVARRDPEATASGYFFDVVGLNLYRNAHDVYDRKRGGTPWAAERSDRVGVDERLAQFGLAKPVWVTELNSMPYDDTGVPGWDPATRNDGFRITLAEQASFLIHAYALGIAAGYETVFWQAMQDDPPPVPDELWGLVRYADDPDNADPRRVRPAYTAYQVAAKYLSSAERAELVTVDRPDPANHRAYAPRYQWWIHDVVLQRDTRRTSVLWNGAATPAKVALPKRGTSAKLVDQRGEETPLQPEGDRWTISLAAASRRFTLFGGDPPGYHYVGGAPLLLVEEGVPADAPVDKPAVLQ
jgi:hypothetical protein